MNPVVSGLVRIRLRLRIQHARTACGVLTVCRAVGVVVVVCARVRRVVLTVVLVTAYRAVVVVMQTGGSVNDVVVSVFVKRVVVFTALLLICSVGWNPNAKTCEQHVS